MIFANKTLDRIISGFALIGVWGMTWLAFYMGFIHPIPDAGLWQYAGYFLGAAFPVVALLITFPTGLIRYVVTGDEFPNGWF